MRGWRAVGECGNCPQNRVNRCAGPSVKQAPGVAINFRRNAMIKSNIKAVALATTALALSVSSFSASADVFTLDKTFTQGLVAPFGTVTLTQDGANEVDVAVTLASGF